jgi:hypothetical protein
MTEWKWNPISLPVLNNLLSTGQLQELPRGQWPQWTQKTPDFFTVWITPLDAPRSSSSGALSSGFAQAEILMERRDPDPPTHRYYRFINCQLADGRIFQGGPSKDIDFGHHLNARPAWLDQYRSA